jgi:exodeoxyribonuclease V gamma subunit
VHLCALVQKAPAAPRANARPDGRWQAGIAQWDSDFIRAGPAGRGTFFEDLEPRVLRLLELWAHPATHPAWYFPRAAAAIVIRQKDDAAEGAWQAERGYAPGYARLLGRGLDFEEGTPEFERLKQQADELAHLLTLGGEGAE